MQYVVFLPALFALYLAWQRSPQTALVSVYLPVLLLLPDSFRAITPGIPDPNFNQATALAIFAVFLARGAPGWRFSLTDLLVAGFAAVVAWSEFSATNYADAQNLMFAMLASVVVPYALGKALIEPADLRVAAARRIVILVSVIVLISTFEFRFGVNPFFSMLGKLFPGQGEWGVTFRYGVARIAGPYGHAILAGIVIAATYRLQRWLERGHHWEARFRRLPALPWSKARILTLTLFVGAVMTIARGPWIGALVGTLPVIIGRARNRRRMVAWLLAVGLLVGIPSAVAFYDYVDVDYLQATTPSQESAAYRKTLIDRYVDIAVEKSAFGWGKNTWPKVPGMPSIDNHFLLIALMHGLLALGLLTAIFVWMFSRLMRRGMRAGQDEAGRNDFSFALAGVFAAVFVSIATVYMGEQVLPLFFLLTGWAESYLLRDGVRSAADLGPGRIQLAPPRPFHYNRIIG